MSKAFYAGRAKGRADAVLAANEALSATAALAQQSAAQEKQIDDLIGRLTDAALKLLDAKSKQRWYERRLENAGKHITYLQSDIEKHKEKFAAMYEAMNKRLHDAYERLAPNLGSMFVGGVEADDHLMVKRVTLHPRRFLSAIEFNFGSGLENMDDTDLRYIAEEMGEKAAKELTERAFDALKKARSAAQ